VQINRHYTTLLYFHSLLTLLSPHTGENQITFSVRVRVSIAPNQILQHMGANSLPSAEANFDLDEQISQLMQCKPLSEQQVCFPLVRHDPFCFDAEFTLCLDLNLFGELICFAFSLSFGISENGRIGRIEMEIALI